jgi:hypothetical protein
VSDLGAGKRGAIHWATDRGMIGRFVQSSRAGSSNRTAGAFETGGFRPSIYTLDWDEPSIVGP